MNPDHSPLLHELTTGSAAGPETADSLVEALRSLHRRRARFQNAASATMVAAVLAVALWTLFTDGPSPAPLAREPVPSSLLTKNELLDAFGDQPVALVTWPDGRQQLLAIGQAPVRSRAK